RAHNTRQRGEQIFSSLPSLKACAREFRVPSSSATQFSSHRLENGFQFGSSNSVSAYESETREKAADGISPFLTDKDKAPASDRRRAISGVHLVGCACVCGRRLV
uniref:Uncharacterized protein n=1 Tax=Anopheles dirus TaxID=7168 RepID=A0A182NXQ7_9DIPT